MVSILIPTYNYNIFNLVSNLHKQITKLAIEFEIIVIDDCSKNFIEENKQVNKLIFTKYILLKNNIGRSKIRNLLAKTATYDWLLFLDADVKLISDDFILNYYTQILKEKKEVVIYGGICYTNKKPAVAFVFRWKYGKERESKKRKERIKNPHLSFLSLNFLIHKNIIQKVKFNEEIPNLRHEDTLFSYDLKINNIEVLHLENEIMHLGLDSFETAIRKENESLDTLLYLLDNKMMDTNFLRISKYHTLIKTLHLNSVFSHLYKISKSKILNNLKGENPSLFLFDLYRLGYLSSFNTSNK
jgi:glycosyltransferase involved in cell wall biosynthesis